MPQRKRLLLRRPSTKRNRCPALPPSEQSPVMEFLYDEFGVVQEGSAALCEQAMLFSNRSEVHLRLRDLRFTLAEPLFASEVGHEAVRQ